MIYVTIFSTMLLIVGATIASVTGDTEVAEKIVSGAVSLFLLGAFACWIFGD